MKPERRICACGCQKTFWAKRPHQKFLNSKHRFNDWAKKNPRVRIAA